MPSPIFGKGEATGSGGPASSAQAASAAAGSAQADSTQSIRGSGGVVSLRFPPDVEYTTWNTTTVASRGASCVPRPMPAFVENRDNVQYMTILGTGKRPVTKLPKSNLEKVEHPPGMSYDETYLWELAMLLEGISPCYEPLPTWSLGSIHYDCSKYLAWAVRHSPGVHATNDNWVSVDWLLNDRRRNMSTPSILLQTILHNEKQRYQFSMPIYKKAESRRATGRSRASGQIYYHAEVYIRAVQGHSVSASPMASLELITRDNLPNNAVHGTNIQAAESIAKFGMIPGGGEGKRQANHFACTLPNDVSTVVSGYRSTSQSLLLPLPFKVDR